MKIRLAYGDSGLLIDLPDECTSVVEPRYVAAAADQNAVLRGALREPVTGRPLRELAAAGIPLSSIEHAFFTHHHADHNRGTAASCWCPG